MSKFKKTMDRYSSNISSLLETDGKWSAMRFMSMFAVLVPISVWAIISIVNWKPAELPSELSAIVLFGLGGKALQSKYEFDNARKNVNDLINMGKPPGSEYNNSYNSYNNTYQDTVDNIENDDIPDNSHNFNTINNEIPDVPSKNFQPKKRGKY